MTNITFASSTNTFLTTLKNTEGFYQGQSLLYKVKDLVFNISRLYERNHNTLDAGTSVTLSQCGYPDVSVEYMPNLDKGIIDIEKACLEVGVIAQRIKEDPVYPNILTECNHKATVLPKDYPIRLNDLDRSILNDSVQHFQTATKEYAIAIDKVVFYMMDKNKYNGVALWPRVFCTYYEVQNSKDMLVPKYRRSIKVDSLMNYHVPCDLDLGYTIY